LRVDDLVTFTGRKGREALRACHAAADVFVTTPWHEPFGITPLEAMACGTCCSTWAMKPRGCVRRCAHRTTPRATCALPATLKRPASP